MAGVDGQIGFPDGGESSHRTLRWREQDSNHRSRVRKKWSMPSSGDQTRVGRTPTLGGGAESSLEGRDIELLVSPKDIRTSPYDLCMISARTGPIDDNHGRGTDDSNSVPSSGESAANLGP